MSTPQPPPPTTGPATVASAAATAAAALSNKVNIDVEQLSKDHTEAVQQIKEIQVLVTSFLDTILVRKHDESEKETQAIKQTIQQVNTIQQKLNRLGVQYAKLRLNDVCTLLTGNTGYVILDPKEDQTGFSKQLIQCYTWLKNLDYDCTRALDALQLKSETFQGIDQKIWKRTDLSLQQVVDSVKTSFPKLMFNANYLASDCCLEVKLDKLFAVRVFFSGKSLSYVVTVSINEHMMLKPWQTSEHIIFQRLSDVFNSVILKLVHKDPSVMLKEFLTFVGSYKDIYEVKCANCNKYLHVGSGSLQFLPPIYRELKSTKSYHLACK